MWISVGCGNYEDTIRQQQVLNFFFFLPATCEGGGGEREREM